MILSLTDFSKKIFAFAGIMLSLIQCMKAYPTTQRWQNPCGSSTVLFANLPPPPPGADTSLTDIVSNMLIRIHEGQSNSKVLMETIGMKRIKSFEMMKYLNTVHNGGLVVDILSTWEQENYLKNVTQYFLESYRTLSIVAVFLEQTKLDEQIYEYDRLKKEIIDVESKVYDILCHMDEAISKMGASIEYVTREEMKMHVETISDKTSRYQRDYVLSKDSTIIMDNSIVMFTKISDQLKRSN